MTPRRRLGVLLPALVSAVALAGCGSTPSRPAAAHTRAGKSQSVAGSCHYSPAGHAARQVRPPSSTPTTHGTVRATIRTNRGPIPITLDAKDAPCTVNSFESLAHQGYFAHTPCHRLTTSSIFVLQCGDPTGTGTGGPGYTLPDELPHLKNCRPGSCVYPAGTLAMAESGTAAGATPNSAGSQFFLVYKDSPLAPSYPVFGKMGARGLSVAKQIASKGAQPPNASGNTAPKEKVTISSVEMRRR